MTPIHAYTDMTPFAGGIVAFQTEKEWYKFHDAFVFEEWPKIKFGILSKRTSRFSVDLDLENRIGYMLYEFLKPRSSIQHHGLPNAVLKDLSLSMRSATPKEVKRLKKAIFLGNASRISSGGSDWKELKELAKQRFSNQT
jgi:hypothetical protein